MYIDSIKVRQNIVTFSGGQVEVKVNNIGAFVVTIRGAELRGKLSLKQRIRRNSNRVSINSTCIYTFICLNVFPHVSNDNL